MSQQAEIEKLLHKSMGLDTASIGSTAIGRAVGRRMDARNIKQIDEYHRVLRESPDELQELIEAIVVPETSFFRHAESFGALRRFVMGEWLPSRHARPLRLLSVACSTGEEPYSMAMALLDIGVAPERFSIEAWDISRPALERAQRAIYGKNSFRSENLGFRDRYFQPAAEGYQVIETVRRQVRFRHENMLDPGHRHGAQQNDVVFCRNVLIYFDRPTQEQALTTLKGLLLPEGILFMGPAEAFLMRGSGFVPDSTPMSFAFRRGDATKRASGAKSMENGHSEVSPVAGITSVKAWSMPSPKAARQPAPKPAAGRTATAASIPSLKTAVSAVTTAAAVPSASSQGDDLISVRRLADAGRMAEAAQAGEAFLRANGDVAEGHYLLGIVYDALGDPQRATQSYRKAIYLDPNHSEALVHLALLAERQGDAPEAKRLHERARRVASKQVQ